MEPYRAPAWLPGRHLQTIVGGLWPAPRIEYERERWITPDGDFIDVDWAGPEHAPRLMVLFHGVGGNSAAHYARMLAGEALATRCWRIAVPHFRGCSGVPNDRPRSYFSGDYEELDWILERFRRRGDNLYPVGVSLGGNSLLRWLSVMGGGAPEVVRRAAAISAQFDLAASGARLETGCNRIYGWWLILKCDGLRRAALDKFDRFPREHELLGIQRERVSGATTFPQFDDALVGPLHGFGGKDDYWARCSTLGRLARIKVPTLLLNARNDPFYDVPAAISLQPPLAPEFPQQGGHTAFPSCANWMPRRVLEFLSEG